jgi:hypothetical protein
MPCGGIVDVHVETAPEEREWHDDCTHCGKYHDEQGAWPNLYIEEWDGLMVHKSCLVAYLETEEGSIIRNHNHGVYFDAFDWIEEGKPWPDNWKTILETASAKS